MASATLNDPVGLPIVANPNGEPIDVENHFVNFGAEYVYHCHILSHEEMDMMRPVVLAYPPRAPYARFVADAPGGPVLAWTDISLNETAFAVEKLVDGVWTEVPGSRVVRPLTQPLASGGNAVAPNGTGEEFTFTAAWAPGDRYRIVAENTVGDTWNYANPNNEIVSGGFPTVTARAYAEVTIP
jgi:hypothetical protein